MTTVYSNFRAICLAKLEHPLLGWKKDVVMAATKLLPHLLGAGDSEAVEGPPAGSIQLSNALDHTSERV